MAKGVKFKRGQLLTSKQIFALRRHLENAFDEIRHVEDVLAEHADALGKVRSHFQSRHDAAERKEDEKTMLRLEDMDSDVQELQSDAESLSSDADDLKSEWEQTSSKWQELYDALSEYGTRMKKLKK